MTTYWINIWHGYETKAESADVHSTEDRAIEEITAGYTGHSYVETVRVDGKAAVVMDLEGEARDRAWKAQEEHRADLAMSPSWAPL